MNKKLLIIGALSALVSVQANASESCKNLKSKNFLAVYGEQQPLSGVLEQSLKKTGWLLSFNQRSAEPMIKGEVQGDVESVIVGLVSKSVKKGWRINLTFDNDACKAYVDVLNETAPELNTDLDSKSNPIYKASRTAKPVPAQVPSSTSKSIVAKNVYRVKKGELLRDVLSRWAKKNGGDAVWMVENDQYQYPIGANAEFIGDLGGVVAGLLEAIGREANTLKISVYENGYIRIEEFNK